MQRHSFAALFLVACAIPTVYAGVYFKLHTLVLERDSVPGVGLVTSIDNIAVNNAGAWLVQVDTDHADTTADGLLLQNGLLYLREGQQIDPPPATIGDFDSVTLSDTAARGFNLMLDDTGSTNNDSGVYHNTQLLVQEGDLVNLPGLSPQTIYVGFVDVKIANPPSGEDLLLIASVEDPNIPSSVDRVLLTLGPNGDQTLIAKEGDTLPGQVEQVFDFLTGPHATAYTNTGAVMFVANMNGNPAFDLAIYIDDTLVAQEGSSSPVDSRNWTSLASTRVDLATTGNYVHTGTLAGDPNSDQVLVTRDGKFVQERDALAAIAPFQLISFGTGPVLISDREQVLWFGDWNDPDIDEDTGLLLNEILLIQEGVTAIAGRTVQTVRGVENGYKISRNGRFIICELEVLDSQLGVLEGAFLIEFCLADIDLDGVVGQADLGILLATFGRCPGGVNYNAAANIETSNPCINQADLGVLLSRFGQPCN